MITNTLAMSKKYEVQIENLIASKQFPCEGKKTSWPDQFRNSVNVNNGDVENASLMDHFLHSVSFFWKVFSFWNSLYFNLIF